VEGRGRGRDTAPQNFYFEFLGVFFATGTEEKWETGRGGNAAKGKGHAQTIWAPPKVRRKERCGSEERRKAPKFSTRLSLRGIKLEDSGKKSGRVEKSSGTSGREEEGGNTRSRKGKLAKSRNYPPLSKNRGKEKGKRKKKESLKKNERTLPSQRQMAPKEGSKKWGPKLRIKGKGEADPETK